MSPSIGRNAIVYSPKMVSRTSHLNSLFNGCHSLTPRDFSQKNFQIWEEIKHGRWIHCYWTSIRVPWQMGERYKRPVLWLANGRWRRQPRWVIWTSDTLNSQKLPFLRTKLSILISLASHFQPFDCFLRYFYPTIATFLSLYDQEQNLTLLCCVVWRHFGFKWSTIYTTWWNLLEIFMWFVCYLILFEWFYKIQIKFFMPKFCLLCWYFPSFIDENCKIWWVSISQMYNLNDHKSMKFYKRYNATEVILHVADFFQFCRDFQRE